MVFRDIFIFPSMIAPIYHILTEIPPMVPPVADDGSTKGVRTTIPVVYRRGRSGSAPYEANLAIENDVAVITSFSLDSNMCESRAKVLPTPSYESTFPVALWKRSGRPERIEDGFAV